MTLADPSISLVATVVLAFVVGEFVLADLISSNAPRRLASLALYVPAALWPWASSLGSPAPAPLLPLLVLLAGFTGVLAWCDSLALGGSASPGTGKRVTAPASMTRRYGALALKVAALCIFLAVLTSGRVAGQPSLGLPVAAVKVLLWSAAYLFVLPGGTALVRYVLDAAGPAWLEQAPVPAGVARPPQGLKPASASLEVAAGADLDRETVATVELRRGRIIGNVERLIVTTLVSLGQFGAIGLVLTAKSLARFPQLSSSRDFAEYYLIGTLVSVAVAMAAGLLLAAALVRL